MRASDLNGHSPGEGSEVLAEWIFLDFHDMTFEASDI
jgi:hypothetical protein